jgi:hypothetical protein
VFLRLRRFLELEPPESTEQRWKNTLYWILWLVMAGLAAALLLATLNGAP